MSEGAVDNSGELVAIPDFLDRFLSFEDGVISRIAVVLPRGNNEGRQIELEIQALDRTAEGDGAPYGALFGWKLVRLTLGEILGYSLSETPSDPFQVLYDGLKLEFLGDQFVLDLDPGPDDWSPFTIQDPATSYSKRYVLAKRASFEVLDGPFI
ncbi:hypothetical protein [Salinispora fenicalii]|uniref:hypothetical protein n=1 Tax=Salinispora fenicalii TaxID=1137263 RepID=UPI0012BD65AC|nr:hypothetical protein [Salinispora fenicalii]